MEVSRRTNGISFSELGDEEQDEIIRLKYSCRSLGGQNGGICYEICYP